MWPSRLANSLARIVNPVARVNLVAGGLALGVMMLTVVSDVALRAGLNKGVWGNLDIVSMMLVIVMFSGYAYTQLQGKHIQVDVLVRRLSATAQKAITLNGYLLTLGVMVITAYQCFVQAAFMKHLNSISPILRIPNWPLMVFIALSLCLFCLALLLSCLKDLDELLTVKRAKAYVWLLPGSVVTLGLIVLSLWPGLLPGGMTREMWGGLVFVLLFVLIFFKVHIGTAMLLTAFLGLSYLISPEASLYNLSLSALDTARNYTWSVAPLFIWMGFLVFYAGFAKELYAAAYRWIGHIPGGLASATTAACAGLAAIVGDPQTGVLTMGSLALPQMRAYKYDPKLATATICTASTIGMLIPPSLGFIIYGMITEVSIGKLFMAGVLPGLLFATILIVMITIMCRVKPELGPPGPRSSWHDRLLSLKDTWSVVALVVVCLGGIYAGIFTPTESGAIGAFGAIVIGVVRRRLTFRALGEAAGQAIQVVAVIFFIFVFAIAFSHFLALTNLPYELARWVVGLNLGAYGIIALIILIYMVLGCIMNSLPAVILTLPIFFPIAVAQGFDPVWFGVLIVVMVNLGQITPPIGMNVFAMSAIARDVPMYDIFRGVLPFWGAFLILTILLVLFPQICLVLPNLM